MALTSTLHVCADRLGLLTAVLCAAAAGSKDLVVFYETVQALARSAITLADLPEILGITLAHEIGHLLLGPERHSATGLMRADWSRGDLEDAAKGRLLFSKEHARRMRAELDEVTLRSESR